jgi:neuralized-like protein 4
MRRREYSNAVLLSNEALENNEIFEIKILEVMKEWSGSLRIGVVSNESGSWLTSMNLVPGMTSIPADSWYLTGLCNASYSNSFLWLIPSPSL